MIFNIVTYKQVNKKKKKAPFIHHVLQHHQSKKPIIVSPLFEWIYLLLLTNLRRTFTLCCSERRTTAT